MRLPSHALANVMARSTWLGVDPTEPLETLANQSGLCRLSSASDLLPYIAHHICWSRDVDVRGTWEETDNLEVGT
jgi:hypothetical protein